ALDHVQRRIAPVRVVVAGRHVHPERPRTRIAERVVAQHVALEDVLLEPAGELARPWLQRTDSLSTVVRDAPRPAAPRRRARAPGLRRQLDRTLQARSD